jgi:hypothetical protein
MVADDVLQADSFKISSQIAVYQLLLFIFMPDHDGGVDHLGIYTSSGQGHFVTFCSFLASGYTKVVVTVS